MKFVFSYDVIVPGVIEVEAASEEEGEELLFSMSPQSLLRLANTESVELLDSSVHMEDSRKK
jgi:hypothetical protein